MFSFGGNAAAGVKFNVFTFELCFYVRTCVRTGFGIYAGGGLNGGFNFGPTQGNRTGGWTGQFAAEAAAPGTDGRLLGRGSAGNVGPTLGAGVSVGFDLCKVRMARLQSIGAPPMLHPAARLFALVNEFEPQPYGGP